MIAKLGIRPSTRSVSTSVIALGFGSLFAISGAAFAQEAAGTAAAENNELIIVTGSRIQRSGFDAPTPTTVLSAEELALGNRPSIADALNDVPQFRATSTPATTTGNTGAASSPADLRGLGSNRTLTLLNGHRFTGSKDLNIVPQNIIKRVDVVTGGASAAWGSGAVAGVVNIIVDDELTGLKLGLNTGISTFGDGERYGADIAWGTKFADGRGHFMIAGEYLDDKGAWDRDSRKNMNAGLFQRANGDLILAEDVKYTILNRGGSILGFDASPYNLIFNPDGSIGPLPLGSETVGQQTIGGAGQNLYEYLSVSTPYERRSIFARASYEITDTAKIWIDGSYNRMSADFGFFPDTPISVIMPDNAFLTDTARAQLATAGIPGPFILGRILDDVGPDRILNYRYKRRNIEVAVGIDGTIADRWTYKAYYNHGELRDSQWLENQRITANFDKAVDSVLVGGTPVCRVNADADPSNNDPACVPINILGNGNISDAARAYSFATGGAVMTTKLDTVGVSLSGELFSTWAGPVDVAVGSDWRWEEFITNRTDPYSVTRALTPLSYSSTNGSFDVKEFFAEVNVPLLDVADTAKLEVNGAARYSDYSTSGGIWTWKTGATGRFFNDLLLRAVYSRDIRSPTIDEYYLARATNIGNMVDPFRGTPPGDLALNVFSYTGGNTDLQPEISHTLTLGGSYSPSFVPGLRLSVDFYKIKIDDVIVTLTGQDVLGLCYAADPGDDLCGGIIERGGDGALVSVLSTFRNLATYKTKGLDLEASYQRPLGSGMLTFRALATHVFELMIDDGVNTSDRAGIVGGDTIFSTPKWRGTGTVTYQDERFGADLRLRYVDGGLYSELPVVNNKVNSRTYVDVGLRVKVGAFTLYGNVNNVFNLSAPRVQYANPNYEVMGRYFSGGVKVNF